MGWKEPQRSPGSKPLPGGRAGGKSYLCFFLILTSAIPFARTRIPGRVFWAGTTHRAGAQGGSAACSPRGFLGSPGEPGSCLGAQAGHKQQPRFPRSWARAGVPPCSGKVSCSVNGSRNYSSHHQPWKLRRQQMEL